MSKELQTLFLEEWLQSSARNSNYHNNSFINSSNSSAQSIIQAWAELRNCLQQSEFRPSHLNALKTLINSHISLYVADPQAKLLITILSSPKISLSHDAYPLFLRLLYVWIRKSSKPSLNLVDAAVDVISHLFDDEFDARKSTSLFAEGVLLAGAFCCVPSLSEKTKTVSLQLICGMLVEKYHLVGPVGRLIPHVLAGIGYALSSCGEAYTVRLLNFLLDDLLKIEVPHDASDALLILHLIEWVVFNFINSGSSEKLKIFSSGILGNPKSGFAIFAVLMASAGALRALSRPVQHAMMLSVISTLRLAAEAEVEAVATHLISKIGVSTNTIIEDAEVNFLLQCLSVAVARIGGVSSTRGPLAICLTLALLREVFPLRRFHMEILESPKDNYEDLISGGVKRHLNSILFMEAGATTGAFCRLYASAEEKDKLTVEDLVWSSSHDIYIRHREVAFLLRGRSNQLLSDLEKIAESAFLMTVVFALAVTKHKLTSKFPKEIQMDASVRIMVSFSCLEYFRRIRVPEYMETIRAVVTILQENETAFVSFVESLPSYVDLTKPQGSSHLQTVKYVWSKDEVQTARVLFYLRVISNSISHLPSDLFQKSVAATMFLYLGHPNTKVSQAAHAVFVSFVSSEKSSDQNDRVSLKEKLVFYYMKRSLKAYPGITPFDALASGVLAVVRHLPAGSPSTYYCIHTLVDKANVMCKEVMTVEPSQSWKNLQGDSEACMKILELLLRLISMVDIQVLPEMMKLLAQLIMELPKDGQDTILGELYALFAESDDVTRKLTLVSWLQSLSYLCAQSERKVVDVSSSSGTLNLQNISSRL